MAALLGFGASGSLLTLYRRYRGTEAVSVQWLPWTVAGACMGLILAVLVVSNIPFNPFSIFEERHELWNGISYLVVVTLPFLFIGATIAIALDAYSGQAGTLYFADLFGAGLGCIAFIFLMDWRPRRSSETGNRQRRLTATVGDAGHATTEHELADSLNHNKAPLP